MNRHALAIRKPTYGQVRKAMDDDTPEDIDDEKPANTPSEGKREGTGRRFGLRLGVGIAPLTDLLRIEGDVNGTPASEKDEAVDAPSTGETVTEEKYLITTDRTDDEFVVTADLPGVSREDIAVGIGSETNDLVIRVRGTTIKRISLPWEMVVTTAVTYNNYVLEIHLSPADL